MASAAPQDYNAGLYKHLSEVDPEVQKIIDNETYRQFSGLELIASEVRPLFSGGGCRHLSDRLCHSRI